MKTTVSRRLVRATGKESGSEQEGRRNLGSPASKSHATKTSNITKAAITIGVAAALLTGCAATTNGNALLPTSKHAATTTETPASTVLKTGDRVSEADVQTILKAGNGQRAYSMADGTFVVVTKTEPLPAAVQSDIDAQTAATLATVPNASADMNGVEAALGKAQLHIAVGTGKRVIIVWRALAFWGFEAEVETYEWMIDGGPPIGQHFVEKSEAQTVVDEWLASKDNANEYVVVYVG